MANDLLAMEDDFSEASFMTTKSSKATRMGTWETSSSSARRIQMQKDSWDSIQDWNTRGQPEGEKLGGPEKIETISSSSRRLSELSRSSADHDDDVRSMTSSSSGRRSKPLVEEFSNRATRSRFTTKLLRDDFDKTMETMIHDFDSQFSSSFWDDEEEGSFFRRRRKHRNTDDFFSRSNITTNRSSLQRSRMQPSLFDSSFGDFWGDKRSNLEEDYAESGIFSDRASSSLSQQDHEPALKKQHPADKFEVDIDVEGFKANELLVRTEGRRLIILANKKDKNGNLLPNNQELKREFVLPEGVNPYDVTSNLMPNGCLRVEAPLNRYEKTQSQESTHELSQKIGREFSGDDKSVNEKTFAQGESSERNDAVVH